MEVLQTASGVMQWRGALRKFLSRAVPALVLLELGAQAREAPFLFDPSKKHASIMVRDCGRAATKEMGDDYQSVLLRPSLPPTGRHCVEFLIERQAEPQCFFSFGVCLDTHDYRDGRSALAADEAWTVSTQSGKHYHSGGDWVQYFPGYGTPPLYPGDEAMAGAVRPREGDRVGLLVDMDEGTLSVAVNSVDQGVMTSKLPKDRELFFVVDMSDEGQRLSILPES